MDGGWPVPPKAVGYNNPRELFDPLVAGETIGTIFGAHTWVPGEGLRLTSRTSYVQYALPATVAAGEFSMEIKGLAPGGPIGKPRLFSMLNGTGRLDLSKYQMNVQYRGTQGNPDNCIAFKAVWGDEDVKLEPSCTSGCGHPAARPGALVLLPGDLGCADLPADRPRGWSDGT